MLERAPALLKQHPQWLLWRRGTKEPLQANGYPASVIKPETWCSFDSARTAYEQHSPNPANAIGGMGFVLGYKSRVAGSDFDKCFDNAGNIVRPEAIDFAQRFDTYTEVSPSGTGLHCLFIADVARGRKVGPYEMYGGSRYFTVTGNVYFDKPLAERQSSADSFGMLLDQRSKQSAANSNVDWGKQPTLTHDEVWARCIAASNSGKFMDLWEDRWQTHYASHSEADIALVNLLAFWSDSPTQVMYMFSASPCCIGATDDKYRKRPVLLQGMIAKAFDQKVPTADLTRVLIQTPPKPKPVVEEDDVAREADPFTMPPGALGSIAQFIYQQAPYPMKEAAIAAALTLMGGICGRQYQFKATGLNLYIMLLANTGAGKEQMSTGIGKLMAAITQPSKDITKTDIGYPAAKCFRGPAQVTGKGLHRVFEKCDSLSFFSIGNEFADTMRQMADPKGGNQGISDLKRALLDMYTKGSEGNDFAGAMTADKDTSIGTLNSPAFTLLVESTPDKLYSYLTPELIKEGLLSRMLVIHTDYFGEWNEHHHTIKVEPALRDWLRALCDNVFVIKRENDRRIEVAATPEASERIEYYRRYARERLIKDDESTRDLWNRAALATNRIAALVAIGCNYTMPTIQVEYVDWAWGIVSRQVVMLSGKFRRGETGDQSLNTNAQVAEVMKACDHFLTMDVNSFTGQQSEKILKDGRMSGYVPYGYILMRTCNRAAFKGLVHKRAVQEALDAAIRSGLLVEAKHPDHPRAQYYSVPIHKPT